MITVKGLTKLVSKTPVYAV